MIFIPNPTRLQGFGIQQSGPIRGRCINRTGSTIVRGEVFVLDLDATDGDVVNDQFGAKDGIWGNVIATTAGAVNKSAMSIVCVFEDQDNDSLINDAAGIFTFVSTSVPILCEDKTSGTATTVIASHFGIGTAGDKTLAVEDSTEVAIGTILYAKANLEGVGTDLTTSGGILTACHFDGFDGLASVAYAS